MKEINVDKIKNIKKPKINAQFGVPIRGRGKLGADNIYIPETKTVKQVQNPKSEDVKEKVSEEIANVGNEAANNKNVTEKPVVSGGDTALIVPEKKTRSISLFRKNKKGKSLKVRVRETKELFRIEGETRVVSVNTAKKKKRLSIGTVMTVAFFLVLMMFIGINNVQIFENQKMINELKESIEENRELERKLNAELEQKYDLSEIGDYASSELGMVGSENSKKVYIDIGEDDSVEVYEPETEDYGTIVTIMNALGDTFKAWIDVFG